MLLAIKKNFFAPHKPGEKKISVWQDTFWIATSVTIWFPGWRDGWP